MNNLMVFSSSQMDELAGSLCRQHGLTPGVIDWNAFPDGWPNLMIRNAEEIEESDVVFIASFSPDDVFRQMGVLYALPEYHARSLKIILPYFPTGTMERVDVEGEIATAKTLARMLSAIPPCHGSGPAQITIFDIHALQERFYFGKDVKIRLHSAIPLLLERIEDMERVKIAFPDEGARKRFGHMFQDYEIIECLKVREGERRIVTIKEGDPQGSNIIIVDDLIQTGGTVIACANVLHEKGAQSVSIFATHGVFPNNSWEQFCKLNFDKIWITDSCPQTAAAVKPYKPFEVLSLDSLIYR